MATFWASISIKKLNWRRFLIRLCRTTVLLIVILAILTVWSVRALPRAAVNQISRATGARLTMEDITVTLKGRVSIKNLTFSPLSQEQAYDNTILRARHLQAKFAPLSLLKLHPVLQTVEVEGFVLDAQFNLDNEQWNMEGLALKFSGTGQGNMPTIRLRNGALRYSKVSQGQLDIATEIPLNADFQKAQEKPGTPAEYQFDIKTGAIWRGIGQSRLQGTWQKGHLIVSGGIASRDLHGLERSWAINAMALEFRYQDNQDYQLKVRLRNMTSQRKADLDTRDPVQPEFLRNFGLATRFQRFVDRYNPSGTVDIDLNASGNLKHINQSRMTGQILCHDINIIDRAFPYALEHLNGRVEYTQDSIGSALLRGYHGSFPMELSFGIRRTDGLWRTDCHVSAPSLPLNQDMLAALPAKEKGLWETFPAQGNIAVDFTWNGPTHGEPRRHIIIQPLGISGFYREFPYRLENLVGTLEVDNDQLTIHDLVSQTRDAKVTINGTISPGVAQNAPVFDVHVSAQDIPLDNTLAQAFKASQRQAYEAFEPSGKTDADISIQTGKQGTSIEVESTLKEAAFILPGPKVRLHGVQAHMMLYHNALVLRDLKGLIDQGQIDMNGDFELDDRMRPHGYRLTIMGHDIAVSELMKFFPSTLSERLVPWDIQGTVDAKASMKRGDTDEALQYSATINLNRNIIHPPFLPASLNQMTGTITANNKDILLENLHAIPSSNDPNDSLANAAIRLSGRLKVDKNQITQGKLSLLAHQFPITKELAETLPAGVQQTLRQLAPHGPVSLDIPTLSWNVDEEGQIKAQVKLLGASEHLQLSLLNNPVYLNGHITLDMGYNTPGGISYGIFQFKADQLTIKEKTGHNIQTSLVYDPSQKAWIANDVSGDFYGGRLMGRLNLSTSAPRRPWDLQLTLKDGNLDDLLAPSDPNAPPRKQTQGTVNGSLCLTGDTTGATRPLGRVRFEVTQMKAGYVTALAKILAVLQLSEPQEIIFKHILVDSYLKGNTLFLDRCDVAGDALALYGSGTLNLTQEQLDLNLIARGKRLATANPSVLEALTEGLGSAVIRVEVNGNLYDPTITTKTLPLLEDSLHLLGIPPTP